MTNAADLHVLKEVLVAAARGPFFPDWEFHTLFGLQRADLESMVSELAAETPLTGNVALALHNSMNNLLGYPHKHEVAWSQWLSITPAELQVVFSKWQASSR